MVLGIFLVGILTMVTAEQKSSCVMTDSCTCTFADNFKIDLKQMEGLVDDNKPM
jgi:thioredoxin-related protein